jgi:predicted dehydrogenase
MIGAGGIARARHVPGLAKMNGVELAAVSNHRWESTRQVSAEFGFRLALDDWKAVAPHPEVDAVFICTPPYMHKEMTVFALQQGKHVFCQARMAMDLQDATTMRQADRQSDLTTMLCPAPAYMKVASLVKQLLREGAIGEIRHVTVQHPGSMFLDPVKPLHWRQRQDLQGINMLDVGITTEVLHDWFGRVLRVCALGRTFVAERPADEDGRTQVELPDSVQVIGEFERGCTLTALFSGAVAKGSSSMQIHGDRGTILCMPADSFVTVANASGEKRIDVPEGEGEWQVEMQFVNAVREGRKGSPSFEDGYAYMAFTQAVYDSMHSGSWTPLSYE